MWLAMSTLATVYHTNEKIDVSGGWHDAGDYGRYVVPGAKSVADLLIAYDANPESFSDSIGHSGKRQRCSGTCWTRHAMNWNGC